MAWCPLLPNDPGPYPQGRQDPSQVICHRTYGSWAGDYGVGKGSRRGIGFHFLIGKQPGQWVQFYDTAQRCNHAAGGNRDSIGIEVTGTDADVMTDWQVTALGQIVQWLADTHDIPASKYHGGRTGYWHGYRDHADVAGSNHTDGWTDSDWARILAHTGEADDMGWTDDRDTVIGAIGRLEQIANWSFYQGYGAHGGANVAHYYYYGQHVTVLHDDGRMVDWCARPQGWVQEWDTGPGMCDPQGGIVVNTITDGALHVTTRSADRKAAIRVVYAPGEGQWRAPERIG
ncbi:MAG: N-acetylmuramoyl-L-alanine amidase [Acidimicrobiia bacterium]|nr:N-acetylmuramoyl-L-alanine amidase [Acidimicrobiia bacterium]